MHLGKDLKRFFAVQAIFLCLSLAIASASMSYAILSRPQPKANVYVLIERGSGIESFGVHNVKTNISERYVRNILGFNNESLQAPIQWIAVGNSTISSDKTQLDTEATTLGFDRQGNETLVAWITASGHWAFNISVEFTATGDIAINSASCHWNETDNSDNNMYALASLGGTEAFGNNDNCTILWMIYYDFWD